MKKQVICIVGPTASGKTGLGVEVAKALNGEVISADSMQIYKGLDIGTAKVTEEEMQCIKHHLIDICEPKYNFSVANFKELCYDKIKDIFSRGKIPVIVGGTGLYVSAVVKNMNFEEQELDETYRNELYELAEKNSNEYVHNLLKEVDPKSAEEIHYNNLKRVVRALEIAKITGKLKSDHMNKEIERIKSEDNIYDFKIFALNYPREVLYDRINKRIDIMAKNGLIDEARKLYDMNLNENSTCMQAIGYKEIFPYIEGRDTLENCLEKLKQDTKKYAKRQQTWFNNKLDVVQLDPIKTIDELILEIKTKLDN
jgi:tRNA dimethylallyltransferase